MTIGGPSTLGLETVPAFARGPVLAVAAAAAAVLTAVSWRYGYMGDELYFVAASHHLAWGYADQPPLVPLIALAMDTIAPGVVAVLRIPSMLATVARSPTRPMTIAISTSPRLIRVCSGWA